MKRFFIFWSITLIGIVFIVISCVTYTKTTSNKNFAYLYNPVLIKIHPQINFYYKDNQFVTSYITLNNNEFQFTGKYGRVELYYKAFKSFNEPSLTDSGTVIINPVLGEKHTKLALDIKNNGSRNLTIYLRITDLVSRTVFDNYYFIENINENFPVNFLVKDSVTKRVIGTTFINSAVKIKHSYRDTLWVFRYKYKQNFPFPPFSTKQFVFDFSPEQYDSLFFIPNNSCLLPEVGEVYLIKADTSKKGGKILANFRKDFPEIKTPTELLYPIFYLTNSTEFENYKLYKNRKEAIDDFWLNLAKNKYRAAELIKVYYNRVLYANIKFSTYKPGWLTDRGMIYIIFGPPKNVFKSKNAEKWVYSESNSAPVSFIFNKYKNPYCDNVYVLERHLEYKPIWYQAIQTWRDGRVYSVAN
jgi:GWxTD domain-containing protein